MRIRHPYHFVPLGDTIERQPVSETAGHDRYLRDLWSGTLHCRLEAKSPLTIKAHFQALRNAKQPPYIPGSSLKGMVRNLAQMLGAGCGLLFADETVDPKWKRASKHGQTNARQRKLSVPDLGGLHRCSMEKACLVCRVFGYTPERSGSDEGASESLSGWAGKVRFHDSKDAENWSNDAWAAPLEQGTAQWQSQGTYHTPFYFPYPEKSDKPAGWKIYLHARTPTPPHPDFAPEACVSPGTVFSFDVDCENLTPEEFAVLRFALTLQHKCDEQDIVGLRHKLGYGKPIGLGSCEVSIVEAAALAARRYFGEAATAPEDPGCAVHRYLQLPAFRALKEYLAWGDGADQLRYPSYKWFLDNPTASIDQYEAAVNKDVTLRAPENPVLAAGRTPVEPREQTRIPKSLRVKITSTAGGKIRFETVETYGGHKYTGVARNTLWAAKPGDACLLKVDDPVDHKSKVLTGRIAWA